MHRLFFFTFCIWYPSFFLLFLRTVFIFHSFLNGTAITTVYYYYYYYYFDSLKVQLSRDCGSGSVYLVSLNRDTLKFLNLQAQDLDCGSGSDYIDFFIPRLCYFLFIFFIFSSYIDFRRTAATILTFFPLTRILIGAEVIFLISFFPTLILASTRAGAEFQPGKKPCRESRVHFFRRRMVESGRVLNLYSMSPIRGPGIKFATGHNTEAVNELNCNIFIHRYGSGTLLKFKFVISNFFFRKGRSQSRLNLNLKFLNYIPIGIKLCKHDGCPERMRGSGKLINTNLRALNSAILLGTNNSKH